MNEEKKVVRQHLSSRTLMDLRWNTTGESPILEAEYEEVISDVYDDDSLSPAFPRYVWRAIPNYCGQDEEGQL